jgi:hypothetical protein
MDFAWISTKIFAVLERLLVKEYLELKKNVEIHAKSMSFLQKC